jgi:hypothetical protein
MASVRPAVAHSTRCSANERCRGPPTDTPDSRTWRKSCSTQEVTELPPTSAEHPIDYGSRQACAACRCAGLFASMRE